MGFRKPFLALFTHLLEPLFVVTEEQEVVNIPDIAWDSKFVFDVMIEGVHVDVGPELAREVPNRETAPALER
jgi:hypothetical protein